MLALWDDEKLILGAVGRGASLAMIALVLGCSVMTVRRRLFVLCTEGLVRSDGTGWALTTEGRRRLDWLVQEATP